MIRLEPWLAMGCVLLVQGVGAWAQCSNFRIQIGRAPNCQLVNEHASPIALTEDAIILGAYGLCNGAGEAFIWDGSTRFVAPYHFVPAGISASARDMNIGRAIVGHKEDTTHSAYLYHDGTFLDLGILPGHNSSEAHGINTHLDVVGFSADVINGGYRAFIWSGGTMSGLPSAPHINARASDINDLQQIVGWVGVSPLPPFDADPVLWHEGQMTVLPLPRGAFTGEARVISQNGLICGVAGYPGLGLAWPRRAFGIFDGIAIDLGVLPPFARSIPLGINDLGQIVGSCDHAPGTGENKGFIWQNGKMTALVDLLPPGLNLRIEAGQSINNQGQIAADGFDMITHQGVVVLMTPIPDLPGDFNCDKRVNVDDLLGVINHWGMTNSVADFNHNGIVDLPDLAIVIDNWTI